METPVQIDLTGLVVPERIEITQASEDGSRAEFVIEPLERGFGHTLGNSVRRVLLSSLPGAAVWAFRIDGVMHEHQTIQGVVEDVHQIIQNLKSLVISLDEDVSDATLAIQVTQPGAVTAADIVPVSGVTIHDPDYHLMTFNDKRKLNIELHVKKGRGFVLADQHELPRGVPVDTVRIDAIFNPVRRANFSVEETRVGQRTDFDRLTLVVETDVSLDAESAVQYATALVRKYFEFMLYFGEGGVPQVTVPGAVEIPERLRDLLDRPIEDLAELSVRSRNSLQKENIQTLGELVQRTEEEMLGIENFGKKSLIEITTFLDEHELKFGMRLRAGDEGQIYMVEEDPVEATELGEG